MILEALVHRKTVDLVRIAAEDLVRGQFPEVRRVDHGELWTFDVDGEVGERELRRLLDETTLVVNPNVHKVTLGAWRKAPAAGARLVVLVRDRVDARAASVLRAARERRGLGAIRGASRSTVWSLDVEGEDAPAAAERVGNRVAGPQGGLLANPHAQDVQREVVSAP